ncbi:glycoside hydrolase family 3 C-terminal domain-containing protein [Alicyclobacillus fastidiosus]|uniref:Glycoside hydrolase family 3 C-terminal domain-containing protein n=1 Tax=Alicyclobacillus fastidiosus TaxID=392011 RepID=A0ABY6ZJB3_9BACL|nr:glycoside hydrolase family 3 N-terminal domain-containing protein [Alicyclobacillus fastidiosus]WAH43013.1 glycoside hydrolase family 3 C-terminal domain-containing protein [Alicyclobacillus fastidiosus]GMA64985.1 beta-glucosidase [Alicyclobacillus fastidiosus]
MSATYQNTELSVEERVDLLLAEMTIEEKAAQLTAVWAYEVLDGLEFSEEKAKRHFRDGIGQITRIGGATNHGPVGTGRIANEIQQFLTHRTRLQIPAIVHEESCSGYMAKGATCFPQSIGIASTWDETIARRVGAVIREQMRAAGAHQALAPLLDVTRDPRWGRVEETFGEDPYLVAQMGIGYVEGLQGDRLTDGVIATGKHFVGYGISEGGMNWAPAHIPERELHDVYLHPFEAVVRQAKLGSIMPGYHELDGIPCHHSERLLVDVLRNTWGFEGIVVSDYFAVNMLHEYHHVARDKVQAAQFAVQAGVDVELPSRDVYGEALIEAVNSGLVGIDEVDQLVRRVLTMKFRLGLFEHPYVDTGRALEVFDNAEQRALAKTAAQKSIVLLKNEQQLLPLNANALQKLAIIGPNANSIRNMVGDYAYPCHIESLLEMRDQDNVFETPMPNDVQLVQQFVPMQSILESIQEKVNGRVQVAYAEGCSVTGSDESGFTTALDIARDADVAIVVVGDKAGLTDDCTTGESRDRATLGLLGAQQALVEAVVETGTPTVVVFVSGRPLATPWIAEHVPAIVEAWLPGEEGASAVADVLFGDYNPSGRLPITVPRSVGQVPIFYAHKPSGGRSHWKGEYVDESNKPLYAFGHGLSYSTFDYSDLVISSEAIDVHGGVDVSCVVTNTSAIAGEEVVQLYVHDVEADVTRPLQELRGYARVFLRPGERMQVTFTLSAHQLGFYNRGLRYVVEPGVIDVSIGAASDDIRLRGHFTIDGEVTDVESEKIFTTTVNTSSLGEGAQ